MLCSMWTLQLTTDIFLQKSNHARKISLTLLRSFSGGFDGVQENKIFHCLEGVGMLAALSAICVERTSYFYSYLWHRSDKENGHFFARWGGSFRWM